MATLASASETTKYAVASIAAGNRPSGTAVIVVATGERSARAWIAPASPVSVSTAGWIPRASSRSSVSASFASLLADSISDPSSGSAPAARSRAIPRARLKRHQPLLRAVMQVAFQPAPFGVPGLHDPGPGGADLLQLGLHLGLQPGVLQRHAGRGSRQLDQLRLELQPLVVDQDGLVRVCYRHDGPARIRPDHLDGLARGVQVAGPVRLPERQLQRRVTQRPGQRVPEPGRRGSRFQVDDRGAERTARRPGPHRADHEQGRAGQQHQREQGVT